jgi:Dolichyl-phosphate-mannose-protein mannosyltransferase
MFLFGDKRSWPEPGELHQRSSARTDGRSKSLPRRSLAIPDFLDRGAPSHLPAERPFLATLFPPGKHGVRPHLVWLSLILLASFVNRALLFRLPPLRDEGMFGYMAQEWMRGYLPFSTAVDNKGVMLYLDFLLPLTLFGPDSMEGVRFFASLFVGLSILVLYILTCRWWGPKIAVIAAGLFAFHMSLLGFDAHQCGSEVFGMLPFLLSVGLVWKGYEDQKSSCYLWAGVFLGLAVWTRLTFATTSLFFVLFLLWAEKEKRKVTSPLLGVAGALLASLPFLVLYGWTGHLDLLSEAYITYTQAWAEGGPFAAPTLAGLKNISLVSVQYGLVLVVAGLFGPFLLPRREPRTVFLWLWLGSSFFSLLAPRIYLLKQLLQMFPPLCILAAYLIDRATHESTERVRRFFTLGILSLSMALSLFYDLPTYASSWRGENTNHRVFYQSKEIAKWIQANSQPSEGLFCWGLEWQVYFESQRRSPTRHVNVLFPIMLGIAVEKGLPFQEDLAKIQDEMMDNLRAKPPKIMIVTAKVDNYNLSSYTLPQRFESFLDQNYDFVFSDEPFYVFLRKPVH